MPPPHGLVQALQAQSDLRQFPTEGGVIAFENVAWPAAGATAGDSVVSSRPSPGATSSSLRELGLAGGMLVVALAIAEGFIRRRRRHRRGIPTIAEPDDVPSGEDAPALAASEPVASAPS